MSWCGLLQRPATVAGTNPNKLYSKLLNTLSFNTSTAKLESLADSGLELDTPQAGTPERATRLLALVSPEDRGCTLMANRLASA